jgi:hypothetical protein
MEASMEYAVNFWQKLNKRILQTHIKAAIEAVFITVKLPQPYKNAKNGL